MQSDLVVPPRSSWREKALWTSATLMGIGIVTWGFLRARQSSTPRFGTPDCSHVGPGGGEIAGFRYLERVTPGADPESTLPMIVLFHSRGSRPENHAGMFYDSLGVPVRVILPEGPNVLGNHRSWTTKASRTSDQTAWAHELEQLGQSMAKFIHDAVACRPTVGKPVVTGSSEGGHMAYLMGSLYPEMMNGSVAVAGYLPESLWNPDMVRTVGLHGEDDRAVPFARTRDYWAAMDASGADLRAQSFAGVGHSVPSNVSRAWRDALRSML